MPLPFNKTLDVKLLQCVQQHRILYDHNEMKYLDFNAREVVWQQIGDELQRPARLCKSRWVNIRDMMRRRIRERIRNPDQRSYNYKYELELNFMMPFFKETLGDTYNQDEGVFAEFIDEEEKPLSSCDVEVPTLYENSGSEGGSESRDVKPILSKVKKKKRKRNFEPSASPQTNDTANDSVCQELSATDPLDVFLMTIGSTLRTFTPYYLNQAKSKIFTVVQEYELQQIVDKNGQPPGAGAGDNT